MPTSPCWGSGQCEQPNNDWCHAMQSQCEGSCTGTWIVLEPTTSSPTASPVSATPTVTKYPTKSPTTKSPSYVFEGNKCSTEVLSSIDALNKMDTITYTVSTNPYTLSVLAEGGAAGPGGSVVSEGQAYGVLTAALALADTDTYRVSGTPNARSKRTRRIPFRKSIPLYCGSRTCQSVNQILLVESRVINI
jgi:hypothetical protein